jgi:uncharacterized membrane protein
MSPQREITEPGESVYSPRPSWAPALFAGGVTLAVVGIYAEGLAVRGWIFSIIGIVVLLLAFRSLVSRSTRDFFRLPRRQRVRGAVLPVQTLQPPKR